MAPSSSKTVRHVMRCPRPAGLLNVIAAITFAAVFAIVTGRSAPIQAAPAPPPQAPAAKPAAPATPAKAAAPQAPTQAPATPPAGYVGAEVCATCHTGYDTSINASKHGQMKNARTPMASLGCESCHGPG